MRNVPGALAALPRVLEAERPLTARSVVASTLLGTHPPRMEPARLVRVGALFGLAEGTVRTALSRMAAAGELARDGSGRYALAGPLLRRQARQDESRAAAVRPWDGSWDQAVVSLDRRPADERARLRAAASTLRYGELREGIWLRPANLDPGRLPDARAVLHEQCLLLQVAAADALPPLVPKMWDLAGWAGWAQRLQAAMDEAAAPLHRGDVEALAPGFVLSAAVLRHTQADPLLPAELLPDGWPGSGLRDGYEEYDRLYRALLADQVLDIT
jgi:phenylacetic acid degradation operon negative regulatory protein